MKTLQAWFLRSLLMCLAIGGVIVLHILTTSLGEQVKVDRMHLQAIPAEALYVAAAQSDLQKRGFDIQRIRDFVLDRDTIIEAVSAIEAEGVRQGVEVEVRDIAEELEVVVPGKTVVSSGPFQNVRVKLTAFGDPEKLIRLLHGIEHLPYILHLDTWDLRAEAVQPGQGLAGLAPPDVQSEPELAAAQVNIEVIVLVEKVDD